MIKIKIYVELKIMHVIVIHFMYHFDQHFIINYNPCIRTKKNQTIMIKRIICNEHDKYLSKDTFSNFNSNFRLDFYPTN